MNQPTTRISRPDTPSQFEMSSVTVLEECFGSVHLDQTTVAQVDELDRIANVISGLDSQSTKADVQGVFELLEEASAIGH